MIDPNLSIKNVNGYMVKCIKIKVVATLYMEEVVKKSKKIR